MRLACALKLIASRQTVIAPGELIKTLYLCVWFFGQASIEDWGKRQSVSM